LKTICVVTSTRADYSLLYLVIKRLINSNRFDLKLVVTGMHLEEKHGYTYNEILNDGFPIYKKIPMQVNDDTDFSIAKATGMVLIDFADVFRKLCPDLIILLGDRFEILSASIASLLNKIPVAHIHGGETSEGAYDEAIRHSITKMSWWHFVATDVYRMRVIQLGEDPNRVFNVGGLGVDAIKNTRFIKKNKLKEITGINFRNKNLIITYHPVTFEKNSSGSHFKSILNALSRLKDTTLIFTLPNLDADNYSIVNMINQYVIKNKNAYAFKSLGRIKYYSMLRYVDAVVGNSSSGILEAPTFKIGTVNIGDRQKGRIKASSIIDCKTDEKSISLAIDKIYDKNFKRKLKLVKNPYGNGGASEDIVEIIKNLEFPKNLKKMFFDT